MSTCLIMGVQGIVPLEQIVRKLKVYWWFDQRNVGSEGTFAQDRKIWKKHLLKTKYSLHA